MKIVRLVSLVVLLIGASTAYGMKEALVKCDSATEDAQKVVVYDGILTNLAGASAEDVASLCTKFSIVITGYTLTDTEELRQLKDFLASQIKLQKACAARSLKKKARPVVEDDVDALIARADSAAAARLAEEHRARLALQGLAATAQRALVERTEECDNKDDQIGELTEANALLKTVVAKLKAALEKKHNG